MTKEELIHKKAHEAAMKLATDCEPVAMVVGNAKSLFSNEIDYDKPTYYVPEGPCGFAWVNIKPANSRFAKYLKSLGLVRKDSYRGGVSMYIHQFGQSLTRKEEYAYAYADILREYGIKAYAESRMD